MKATIRERLFPELLLIETRAERAAVFSEAEKRTIRGRRGFVGWVVFGGVLFFVAYTLERPLNWLAAHVPDNGWISNSVLFWGQLVFPPIVALGLTVYYRRLIRRAIRELLNQKGLLLCVPCGYDLRGQIEPRCPECGAAFAKPAEVDERQGNS